MDVPAPMGRVMIHETKIFPTTCRFSAPIPLANPTPNTAPTKVCVVEIGKPNPEAMTTVLAVANCAANARLGVSCVMLDPMVAIIL